MNGLKSPMASICSMLMWSKEVHCHRPVTPVSGIYTFMLYPKVNSLAHFGMTFSRNAFNGCHPKTKHRWFTFWSLSNFHRLMNWWDFWLNIIFPCPIDTVNKRFFSNTCWRNRRPRTTRICRSWSSVFFFIRHIDPFDPAVWRSFRANSNRPATSSIRCCSLLKITRTRSSPMGNTSVIWSLNWFKRRNWTRRKNANSITINHRWSSSSNKPLISAKDPRASSNNSYIFNCLICWNNANIGRYFTSIVLVSKNFFNNQNNI